MANTKIENLVNRLNRAKQVIDVTSTDEFDQYAKKLKESVDLDNDNVYNTYASSFKNNNTNVNEISDDSFKFSKLPKEIIESIKSKPLTVKETSDDAMDELVKRVAPKMNMMEEKEVQKPKFSDFINKNNNANSNNQSQIDYSLIKLIIDNAIKENINQIKTTLLTESKNDKKLSYLKLGDSLQFIDSDGNLYEAKLVFKRNIKKRQ